MEINNFEIKRICFRGQPLKEETPEVQSAKTQEEARTGGAEALSSQGKAFVNMQNKTQGTLTLEEAEKDFQKAFDESGINSWALNSLQQLSKDNNEEIKIQKLQLLTKLVKTQDSSYTIEELFNRINWHSGDTIVKKQINFLYNLIDNEKVESYYIEKIFDGINWQLSDKAIDNQLDYANKLLSYEDLAAYNIGKILSALKIDKEGNLNEKQTGYIEKLIENNLSWGIESIIWDSNGNPSEKQAKTIDKILESGLDGFSASEIIKNIKWDEEGNPEERQMEFLDQLLKDKRLHISSVPVIFSHVQWDKDKTIIEEQIDFINNIMSNKRINANNAGSIINQIIWDKSGKPKERQVKFLNELLDQDIESNNIDSILNVIDWNKDDTYIQNQIDYMQELISDRRIEHDFLSSIFNNLDFDNQGKPNENRVKYLNELLNTNRLTGMGIASILYHIKWNDDGTPNKNQKEFLQTLINNNKLNKNDIDNIFSCMQWDEEGNPNNKQLEILNKLIKNEKITGTNVGNIFRTISYANDPIDENFADNQMKFLDELLKNERFKGESLGTLFLIFEWDENGNPNKKQVEYLKKLLANKQLQYNDITTIFNSMRWQSDSSVVEKQQKAVRTILNGESDSETIWPNFEDKMLILKNGLIFPHVYNIDYSKDNNEIIQEVLNIIKEKEEDLNAYYPEGIKPHKMNEEEQKTFTSLLSKALKNPRQFLDNIPLCHTEMETKVINDKGKTKSFYKINDDKIPDIIKEEYKKRIAEFFIENRDLIVKVCGYLDKDAIQTMMDKRLDKFYESILKLAPLSYDNCEFTKNLIEKNDKYKITINGEEQIRPLGGSGTRKVELAGMLLALQKLQGYENLSEKYNIVENNNNGKINLSKDGVIDFDKISAIVSEGILEKMRVSKEKIKENEHPQKFNGKFIHNLVDIETDENIINLVQAASYGKFESYIDDTDNIYGKANQETKEKFAEKELDFNKWIKPDIKDISFDLKNKNMKIKLWDRNPFEDLFVGNKTSCCTAIGEMNGEYTPLYLLNKSFNVIEMYNDRNEVVGMSRVYMAEVNGKPSLIMDNIELNSNYGDGKTTEKERLKIRDNFFKYANEYAKQVTGNNDTQVYFSTKYANVPTKDLKINHSQLDFLGSISSKTIYMNTNGIATNVDLMQNIDLYKVPKEQ